MKSISHGFSFIELLICISVLSLLALLSVNFSQIVGKARADDALSTLRLLSAYARSEAVIRGESVTLCGSLDGTQCNRSFTGGKVLVFIDRNKNGAYNEGIDDLLRHQPFKYYVIWKGSANSNYMRAHAEGYLSPWGRFNYCPPKGEAYSGRQLVLNRLGRSYETTYASACDES